MIRADERKSVASISDRTSVADNVTDSLAAVARERIAARLVAARCTAATASGDMALVVIGIRAVVAVGSPASHLQTSRRQASGSSWPKIRDAAAKVTGGRPFTSQAALLPVLVLASTSPTASNTAGKRLR